jgi:hypothetical protein
VRSKISKVGDFLKHYMFGHQAPSQFMNGLRSAIEDSLEVDADAVINSIKKEAKENGIKIPKSAPLGLVGEVDVT